MADQTIKQHDTYPPLRGLAAENPLSITGSTFSADTINLPGHGYGNGDMMVLSGLQGGAPLVAGNLYYIVNSALNTFKLALTSGGTAIDLTSDITAGKIARIVNLVVADSMKVNLKGPTHLITGAATVIDPPVEAGGQLFNWQHPWAAGETANPETYDVELEVTWHSGTTPPAVETFPNGTPPTLEIKADLG